MKVAARDVEKHLRAIDPAIRVALVYGPDAGLVRERGNRLARLVVDDADDPFRLVALTPESLREEPSRLVDEAQAMAMFGGRRVIRFQGAGNLHSKAVETLLSETVPCEALVIVEAGSLGPRDSLRKLCEGSKAALALPCYADGPRELEALVRGVVETRGLQIDPDALALLLEQLGEDRLASRNELEKLCLYVGDRGVIDRAAVLASVCIGAVATDDIVSAVFDGDGSAVDPLLRRALAAGESPVGLLRALLRQALRLAELAARVAEGASPRDAVRAARPPLYGPMQDAAIRQLGLWSSVRLDRLIRRLEETEVACKTTGLPEDAIVGRALTAFALSAQSVRRRRGNRR